MKFLLIVGLLVICACLAAAGVLMLRPRAHKDRPNNAMATALAFRVAFSIVLFLSILAGWKLGWIHPSGIPLTK